MSALLASGKFDAEIGDDSNLLPTINKELKSTVYEQIRSLKLASAIYSLHQKLLSVQDTKTESLEKEPALKLDDDIVANLEKNIVPKSDMFDLQRSFKQATFDVKMKFQSPDGKDLKSLFALQAISRSPISTNGKNRIAVAENTNVIVSDMEGFLEGGSSLDKSGLKISSNTQMNFEILGVNFNAAYDYYLVVYGLRQCRWVVNLCTTYV